MVAASVAAVFAVTVLAPVAELLQQFVVDAVIVNYQLFVIGPMF